MMFFDFLQPIAKSPIRLGDTEPDAVNTGRSTAETLVLRISSYKGIALFDAHKSLNFMASFLVLKCVCWHLVLDDETRKGFANKVRRNFCPRQTSFTSGQN